MHKQAISNKSIKIKARNSVPVLSISFCVLLFCLLGFITFKKMTDIIGRQNLDNAMMEARGISSGIGPDVLHDAKNGDIAAYERLKTTLNNQLRTENGIERVYVVIPDKTGYSVIADTADDQDGQNIIRLKDYTPDINEMEALKGYPSSSEIDLINETPLTVYMPIKNKMTEVEGILCIVTSPDRLSGYLISLRLTVVMIICIFSLIMLIAYFVIAYKVSNRDSLTGLPNYDHLIKYGTAIESSNRMGSLTAVIINIKGFKNINQKYGYEEGNNVLIKLSKKLSDMIEAGDFIARIGNDNFLALINNANADYFIKRLKEQNPPNYGDANPDTFPAPIKCGIYKAQNSDTIERVISICTVSMNHNKEKGINDFSYYDSGLYENVIENGNILASFQRAIRNKEFRVFYQPKIDINTMRLCGAEALVRWYKEGDFVSPSYFIPLLESENLVTELDVHILENICKDIKKWIKTGITPVRISTNFSKLHLENPDFGDDVIGVVDGIGVPHQYISIELTESSGYSNMGALKVFIERMDKEGITVAMDDFGTGYSSLSLLGDMDMKDIKIDKSFIDKIGDSKESANFVKNVINMIKDLNREVICEGVENTMQLTFVKNAGCNIVQGYFFDKPLSLNDFEKRLKDPYYAAQARAVQTKEEKNGNKKETGNRKNSGKNNRQDRRKENPGKKAGN